jgi:hypothetical protein
MDYTGPNVFERWDQGSRFWGWISVLALLGAEFALFRHELLREVVWAYPPNSDQVNYLMQAYWSYELLRHHGLRAMLAVQTGPQGLLMPCEAALWFCVAGASRFSALSLNFFHFAAFQLVTVGVIRWLTRRWTMCFIALGLLLTALTPYQRPGGLDDFRMDFSAFCLFGIFIALVLRSRMFLSLPASVMAGVAGGWLVSFRYITAVYLLLILASMFVFLVGRWILSVGSAYSPTVTAFRSKRWASTPTLRKTHARQAGGLAAAGLTIALVAGPVIYLHRQSIHDYYLVGHVTGGEKSIRAIETQTVDALASLEYYPVNLYQRHLGPMFFALSAVLLTAASAFRVGRAGDSEGSASAGGIVGTKGDIASCQIPSAEADPKRLQFWLPVHVFLGMCVVVPLAVLTFDQAKSPVVADVIVAPVFWIVILDFIAITRLKPAAGIGTQRQWATPRQGALVAVSALAIFLGVRSQWRAFDAERFMSRHQRDVNAISAMYDLIVARSRAAGWETVTVFNDQVRDHLDADAIRVRAYERTGTMLDLGSAVEGIVEMPDEQVLQQLHASQVVLVTEPTGAETSPPYPINLQLRRLRPQISAYCAGKMKEIARQRIFGDQVILFVRNASPQR